MYHTFNDRINKISGFKIGHAENMEAATGCTVVIAEKGAVAGVDVRGGAPGTRETDLLNPENMVEKINAVLLTGGSAFGLDAAGGVMAYLEEREIGYDVGVTKVPIVCGAVLFDLSVGDYQIRPDKEMGYKACLSASSPQFLEGNIGAGTGATVGKILGMKRAMKSGLGIYLQQAGELQVGAVVAVNCFGDVVDPRSGEIIAGALKEDHRTFAITEDLMVREYSKTGNPFTGNTTIGVVFTNARLTKSEANKIASMAHNGYARSIRPAHLTVDGDTIFVMAAGVVEADINTVGMLASCAVERAVVRGITESKSLYGYKSYHELKELDNV